MRPNDRRRARRADARPVRSDRERRRRGHVAEPVVVLVTRLSGEGLRPAQRDRPQGRRQQRGVYHPPRQVSEAALVFPPSSPVTVCAPADVALQLAPVQEPSGESENLVSAVTSPSELFAASKPSA